MSRVLVTVCTTYSKHKIAQTSDLIPFADGDTTAFNSSHIRRYRFSSKSVRQSQTYL